MIVNETFWELLGSPPLSSHPTITLPGAQPTTAVITAVTPSGLYDDYPSMFLLTSAWDRIASEELRAQTYPELRGVGAARAGRPADRR